MQSQKPPVSPQRWSSISHAAVSYTADKLLTTAGINTHSLSVALVTHARTVGVHNRQCITLGPSKSFRKVKGWPILNQLMLHMEPDKILC